VLKRYSFFFLFFLSLAGLTWWGQRVEDTRPEAKLERNTIPQIEIASSKRLQLLEVLDRIVTYEHYYHSVYGHFTKLLSRLGVTISHDIADLFEIRVVEASSDKFLVTASSEINGKTIDMVSVDHDYRVQATFSMHQPRVEYVRAKAYRYLREIYLAPQGQVAEEPGVFRGFFRFQVNEAEGLKTAIAVGIRPPVSGMQLEYGGKSQNKISDELDPAIEEITEFEAPSTGQSKNVGNVVMNTIEEVHLAQKIFHGEMGRYAKNWSELSKITSFPFTEKERYGVQNSPIINDLQVDEVPADGLSGMEKNTSFRGVASEGLVIEPLTNKAGN
jgi:hypothetical protein